MNMAEVGWGQVGIWAFQTNSEATKLWAQWIEQCSHPEKMMTRSSVWQGAGADASYCIPFAVVWARRLFKPMPFLTTAKT